MTQNEQWWLAAVTPLIRSFEPGEDKAWCYPDFLFLLPDTTIV